MNSYVTFNPKDVWEEWHQIKSFMDNIKHYLDNKNKNIFILSKRYWIYCYNRSKLFRLKQWAYGLISLKEIFKPMHYDVEGIPNSYVLKIKHKLMHYDDDFPFIRIINIRRGMESLIKLLQQCKASSIICLSNEDLRIINDGKQYMDKYMKRPDRMFLGAYTGLCPVGLPDNLIDKKVD